MSTLDIEFVFIKTNNNVQSGKSTLTFRKQNSTHYRKKNKSIQIYLQEKLEQQIKDLYKKDVEYIDSIKLKDSSYYFYNIKNKTKNIVNKYPLDIFNISKVKGDIIVFKVDENTYYFESLNKAIFEQDITTLKKSRMNIVSNPSHATTEQHDTNATTEQHSKHTTGHESNHDSDIEIELDIGCSDFDCSEIECSDEETDQNNPYLNLSNKIVSNDYRLKKKT